MKIEKVRELARKSLYFTSHDAERILQNKNYAHLILSILQKRKEIFRLAKGFYSKYDDPSLIVYYFKPAYIGLQDAMSYLNLWEQETISIIITVKNVRRGIRKIFGNNVLIKRIKPKYFFGFEFFKVNDFYLPISDAEKTFIDLVYFKEWRKEYWKYFKGKIRVEVLKNYLERYSEKFKQKIYKIVFL